MKKTLVSWKSRDLTIFGKITIIKTLAISKLIFVAQNLTIPDLIIKQINKTLFQFIWGKKDFIVRKLMYKPINEGGANMLNIECFFSALKASWLKKINDSPDSNWSHLGRFNFERITPTLNIISKMNFDKAEMLPDLKKLTKFYQDVVISYAKCNKKNCP